MADTTDTAEPPTEEELAELERMERKSTAGPWDYHAAPKGDGYDWWIAADPDPVNKELEEAQICDALNVGYYFSPEKAKGFPPYTNREGNFALIAALRNAAPRLIAAAREANRLREELAECQADAKASHAMYDRMAREFRSMLQSVDDLTAENAELRAALGIPNPGADT